MYGNEGYIIQRGSPVLEAMRWVFEAHPWDGSIDLRKERGVYNLYVKVDPINMSGGGDSAIDVAPNEMEVEAAGNGRQVTWDCGWPRSRVWP